MGRLRVGPLGAAFSQTGEVSDTLAHFTGPSQDRALVSPIHDLDLGHCGNGLLGEDQAQG